MHQLRTFGFPASHHTESAGQGPLRRQRRRWEEGFTLSTTALVHEAYLKLAGQRRLSAESRARVTATALGVSPGSVKRDWAFARAWLLREMQVSLAGED